jgi:hypothetical protein
MNKPLREFCPHCRSYIKVSVGANLRRICEKCELDINMESKACLRCDRNFFPKSRFNRLCTLCNSENDGIIIY